MTRQKVLDRHVPLPLWVVLDEAVIRRVVGGEKVMHEQLLHLAAVARRPNISLQVLPYAAGAHAAMGNGFVILGFEETDPKAVYLEHLAGSLYLEKPHEIAPYTLTFDHLRAAALSLELSVDLIHSAANQLA